MTLGIKRVDLFIKYLCPGLIDNPGIGACCHATYTIIRLVFYRCNSFKLTSYIRRFNPEIILNLQNSAILSDSVKVYNNRNHLTG